MDDPVERLRKAYLSAVSDEDFGGEDEMRAFAASLSSGSVESLRSENSTSSLRSKLPFPVKYPRRSHQSLDTGDRLVSISGQSSLESLRMNRSDDQLIVKDPELQVDPQPVDSRTDLIMESKTPPPETPAIEHKKRSRSRQKSETITESQTASFPKDTLDPDLIDYHNDHDHDQETEQVKQNVRLKSSSSRKSLQESVKPAELINNYQPETSIAKAKVVEDQVVDKDLDVKDLPSDQPIIIEKESENSNHASSSRYTKEEQRNLLEEESPVKPLLSDNGGRKKSAKKKIIATPHVALATDQTSAEPKEDGSLLNTVPQAKEHALIASSDETPKKHQRPKTGKVKKEVARIDAQAEKFQDTNIIDKNGSNPEVVETIIADNRPARSSRQNSASKRNVVFEENPIKPADNPKKGPSKSILKVPLHKVEPEVAASAHHRDQVEANINTPNLELEKKKIRNQPEEIEQQSLTGPAFEEEPLKAPSTRRAQTAPSKSRPAVLKETEPIIPFKLPKQLVEIALQTSLEDGLADKPKSSQTAPSFDVQSDPKDILSISASTETSRASSPAGYAIAFQKSSQALHFDPGVYSHFKEIETARNWHMNKKMKKVGTVSHVAYGKFAHKKQKMNSKPRSRPQSSRPLPSQQHRELLAIREESSKSLKSRPSTTDSIGQKSTFSSSECPENLVKSSNDSETSDDESLRREAVIFKSLSLGEFQGFEKASTESEKSDYDTTSDSQQEPKLCFDAATQTITIVPTNDISVSTEELSISSAPEKKQRKVQILTPPGQPTVGKKQIPKSQIVVPEEAPKSKYLQRYLELTTKKKASKLKKISGVVQKPIFEPVKPRIRRKSSGRSSRSASTASDTTEEYSSASDREKRLRKKSSKKPLVLPPIAIQTFDLVNEPLQEHGQELVHFSPIYNASSLNTLYDPYQSQSNLGWQPIQPLYSPMTFMTDEWYTPHTYPQIHYGTNHPFMNQSSSFPNIQEPLLSNAPQYQSWHQIASPGTLAGSGIPKKRGKIQTKAWR